MEGQAGEDQRTIASSRHADAHGRTGERQDAGDVECGAAGIVQRTISGQFGAVRQGDGQRFADHQRSRHRSTIHRRDQPCGINGNRVQLAAGQRNHLADETLQFRRKRSAVQFESERDRAGHASEDHAKLLLDGGGEQFAGLLGGAGCGCGIGAAFGGSRGGRRASGRGGGGGLGLGLLISGSSGTRRHQAGFLAHLLGVTLQFHGGNRTVGGGGDHLAQVLDAQIAGRVHARHRSSEVVVRDHVTVVVELHHAAHQIGGGHIAGEHEDAEGAGVGGLPRFGLAGGKVQD